MTRWELAPTIESTTRTTEQFAQMMDGNKAGRSSRETSSAVKRIRRNYGRDGQQANAADDCYCRWVWPLGKKTEKKKNAQPSSEQLTAPPSKFELSGKGFAVERRHRVRVQPHAIQGLSQAAASSRCRAGPQGKRKARDKKRREKVRGRGEGSGHEKEESQEAR